MAQARKKPVAAKAASRKPAALHAAAENQTETLEATIKRLAEEVKKYSNWWHEDRRTVERLEHRVKALEGTLRAISNLARLDVGDFVKRCDHSRSHDDEIPF